MLDLSGEVDHYLILGLPSGEEGAKLTQKDISKAYRIKALELHPDKRPDDEDAKSQFQQLTSSYKLLNDEMSRKLFDNRLSVLREHAAHRAHQDPKRRRMVLDLESREKSAFTADIKVARRQEEEVRIALKLEEEIEKIKAMMRAERSGDAERRERAAASGIDKERLLKLNWKKVDYTSSKLKEIFSKYGEVENIVIKASKEKGSALVLMATKEAAVTATTNLSGSLLNPRLVIPFAARATNVARAQRIMDPDPDAFEAYQKLVLEKLRKAASRQGSSSVENNPL